jgi:beta-lactamase regulating signal transducer with metallopeptidase domain
MSVLFDSTIKVSLVLLVAIGAVEALGRRSAAVRHWTLAVAVGCAAVAPLLGLLVPAWDVPVAVFTPASEEAPSIVSATAVVLGEGAEPGRAPEAPRATTMTRPTGFAWPVWLPLAWSAGAAVSLFTLIVGLTRLAWLAASAEKVDRGRLVEIADEIRRAFGLQRDVMLLVSSVPGTLGTWGVIRPKVLLPAIARTWSDDRLRIVLRHELAHVRRGDWMTQLTALRSRDRPVWRLSSRFSP